MKIAITGAHRVGKTTLAEKLAESLTDHEVMQEAYYELQEHGASFSEVPTMDEYIDQLDHSLRQAYSSTRNVIYDRCPIDHLAYIHALDDRMDISEKYHKVKNAVNELDLLIFVPVETIDRVPCGKSDLPLLRLRVNEILNEWVTALDVEVIEVNGSVEDRAEEVLAIVQRNSRN